jgi:hypothetical protein
VKRILCYEVLIPTISLLEILSNPKHEEYPEMIGWLKGIFKYSNNVKPGK